MNLLDLLDKKEIYLNISYISQSAREPTVFNQRGCGGMLAAGEAEEKQ